MSEYVNNSTMESEDRIEQIVDIYISAEAVRDMKHKKDNPTTEIQTPQHTGNNCAKSRNSIAALLCSVLLCFLLLTAVIVLSVYTNTNNTNYTKERRWLLTNITNLTEQNDELICKNTNLTEEKNVLIRNHRNVSSERDQLKLKNENLTKKIQLFDEWTYNQFSFYYISNETKNMTEGRKDCRKRGADLIIIDNQQEQDFVYKMSGAAAVWIGLTDREVEDTWKWVDGSTLTTRFWAKDEPNGKKEENCVVSANKVKPWSHLSGWIDISCEDVFQWICKMSISQFLQNFRNN